MIEVSKERIAVVNGRPVKLSKVEYMLLEAFGMMGDKFVPIELLMDVVFEHPVRIDADRQAMVLKVCKLRKKIGLNFVECVRNAGYRATEEIRFI